MGQVLPSVILPQPWEAEGEWFYLKGQRLLPLHGQVTVLRNRPRSLSGGRAGPEANLTQAQGQEKCYMKEISKKGFKIWL